MTGWIIAAFIAGEAVGWITAAIITGKADDYMEWRKRRHEKKKLLPNFEHKPTGLKIAWYKYPMRDAYSNQNVDIDEFKRILDDCASSMNG